MGANYLILSELGVMHVLVPMFLDGALSAGREGLFELLSALFVKSSHQTAGNVPWQSQPNCYPHRASASSDAPQPVSKECWCDFSSAVAGRPHRWQEQERERQAEQREPEPEPEGQERAEGPEEG